MTEGKYVKREEEREEGKRRSEDTVRRKEREGREGGKRKRDER